MNAVLIWALIVANCTVAVVAPVWLLLLAIRLFHRLCGRPVIWIVLRWMVCLPVFIFRGVVDAIAMIFKALVLGLLTVPLWLISGLDHLARLLRRPVLFVTRVVIVAPVRGVRYALLQGLRQCLTTFLGLGRLVRTPALVFSRVFAATAVKIFYLVRSVVIHGAPLALKVLTDLPGFIRHVCQIIPVAPDYFLLLWADLWAARRGQAAPDNESGEAASDSPEPEPEPVPRTFLDARRALGLPVAFTPAMFKQAYRAAMKRAHPDLGGTADAARAIAEAAAIIRRHKGWA